MTVRTRLLPAVLSTAFCTMIAVGPTASAATSIPPYVEAVGSDYAVTPLFSVGDEVPETSNPLMQYQMVGIPDGLGAHGNPDGTSTLFMNHEFTSDKESEPVVGGSLYRGAFVSKWILDADGNPISGERAYDDIFVEDAPAGSAAEVGNATRAFGRFCSGFLAGPEQGFDRHIYLAGEEVGTESTPDGHTATFDPLGGSAVAIFDNEAHVLPGLGHMPYENVVVKDHPGKHTVIFPLEDGPSSPDSQLYMYVGEKDKNSSSVLGRNGLDNGTLYVFRSTTAGMTDEVTFQQGSIQGEWVPIPGAATMTDDELQAASVAAGAFGFVRIEDGAFNAKKQDELFFVTTGGGTGNQLGRLYSLRLHSGDPASKKAELTIAYNADQVIAAGGDIAISPDNVDASRDYLMINEDGTSQSRTKMGLMGRDGSVWRFDVVGGKPGVDVSTATRVAELNPPGRDGAPVGPGVWETSGIIDVSDIFGTDVWLYDVQAHPPTTQPEPNTIEDGQLILMTPLAE